METVHIPFIPPPEIVLGWLLIPCIVLMFFVFWLKTREIKQCLSRMDIREAYFLTRDRNVSVMLWILAAVTCTLARFSAPAILSIPIFTAIFVGEIFIARLHLAKFAKQYGIA